jgi:hypothetical protein
MPQDQVKLPDIALCSKCGVNPRMKISWGNGIYHMCRECETKKLRAEDVVRHTRAVEAELCTGCRKRPMKFPYRTCTVCMKYWTTGRMVARGPRHLIAWGWIYLIASVTRPLVKVGYSTRHDFIYRLREHETEQSDSFKVLHLEQVRYPFQLERWILEQMLPVRPEPPTHEWFRIDALGNLGRLVKYGNLGRLQEPSELTWVGSVRSTLTNQVRFTGIYEGDGSGDGKRG